MIPLGILGSSQITFTPVEAKTVNVRLLTGPGTTDKIEKRLSIQIVTNSVDYINLYMCSSHATQRTYNHHWS